MSSPGKSLSSGVFGSSGIFDTICRSCRKGFKSDVWSLCFHFLFIPVASPRTVFVFLIPVDIGIRHKVVLFCTLSLKWMRKNIYNASIFNEDWYMTMYWIYCTNQMTTLYYQNITETNIGCFQFCNTFSLYTSKELLSWTKLLHEHYRRFAFQKLDIIYMPEWNFYFGG